MDVVFSTGTEGWRVHCGRGCFVQSKEKKIPQDASSVLWEDGWTRGVQVGTGISCSSCYIAAHPKRENILCSEGKKDTFRNNSVQEAGRTLSPRRIWSFVQSWTLGKEQFWSFWLTWRKRGCPVQRGCRGSSCKGRSTFWELLEQGVVLGSLVLPPALPLICGVCRPLNSFLFSPSVKLR